MKLARRFGIGFIAAALAATALAAAETPDTRVPSFDLPRHSTGERVRLADFGGQILVLDFFAWWCAPCARASSDLEIGVQQFYAGRHGNRQGAPVRVVSVNIEKDLPARTAEFLRKTGASFVVDDPGGALLKQFGSAGIPFLVIVDGTRSSPGSPAFERVYEHAGFEGVEKFRHIIDSLGHGATHETPSRADEHVPPNNQAGGAPRVQTLEADSEFVWAADILMTDTRLNYTHEKGATEWDASLSYASYDIDYQPFRAFDFFGFPTHLHEGRFSGQANVRQRVAAPVTLLLAAGAYDGYADYRSVWIANRYRQKYDHPGFPRVAPYEEPDPKGANVSAGARWEYLPAAGFAEFRLGYAKEQIAPGYEDSVNAQGNYQLVKGRDRLDVRTLNVSSENILTRRLRMRNEFAFNSTTGREWRFGYQGSLNLALGERWVARVSGGVTTEAPRFNARFFGATLEWEPVPKLLVSVSGRSYKDTGEIENSVLLSNAAPPLETWEAGVGLRYSWSRSSVKFFLSAFHTDYAALRVGTAEFFHLYQDRNWGLAQVAYSVRF